MTIISDFMIHELLTPSVIYEAMDILDKCLDTVSYIQGVEGCGILHSMND